MGIDVEMDMDVDKLVVRGDDGWPCVYSFIQSSYRILHPSVLVVWVLLSIYMNHHDGDKRKWMHSNMDLLSGFSTV